MKNRLFAFASASILAGAISIGQAAPPHGITLDGNLTVGGAEWQADELVASQATLGADFGPQQYMDELYVTWDATSLHIGVAGNFSSMDANGVVVLIDTTPGAPGNPGSSNTSFFNDTAGGSNAAISNPNISFPSNFRPDFAAASFLQGLRLKTSGTASDGNIAIYDVLDGAMFVEGSLNGEFVTGNADGTVDDLELTIPWADLYGGAPPANSEIGVLAYVASTTGFSSSVFLPALQGTAPIDNPGNNNISVLSDPGLSGFVRIPVTDGGGAFLTSVTPTLDNLGGISVTGVEQVFDTNWLQVTFTDGAVLDAGTADVAGNYAVNDDMGMPLGINVTAASIGLNGDSNKAYLQLDASIPTGQAYQVEVTGATANGGTPLDPATQSASATGWRRVLFMLDGVFANETANAVGLNPVVRGAWDGFNRRSALSDSADAFPNIPGDQSVDAVNGDDIYEGVVLVTDVAAMDFNFAINAVIPNTPGSDGGADQFVGIGYYIADDDDGMADEVARDLVLPAAATTFMHADPIQNRRLVQNTTVNFQVFIPATFPPADLMTANVRLQGGTGLGGFSAENIVEPLVTGGADKGEIMSFVSSDASGSIYGVDVMFPAGALDVTEFRFVIQDVGGVLGGDFFEQDSNTASPGGMGPPLGSVHLHVARLTEMDRMSPNDQSVDMFVSSYDVPTVIDGVSPATDWDKFE